MLHHIIVHSEPAGGFTARVLAVPEIQATADTEQLAIEQTRAKLMQWLASARVVPVSLPIPGAPNGFVAPDDPIEKEYLEELARMRQEDLERTLK